MNWQNILKTEDWKKRLKRIQRENKKKQLDEQGPAWKYKGGFKSIADSGRRAVQQSTKGTRTSYGVQNNKIRSSKKPCEMCGQDVMEESLYESVSRANLCKRCAENRDGK
tara:strand:+ start:211 stop:540 length:330 start_codon:yes stop_codon:yes gene_type:complete